MKKKGKVGFKRYVQNQPMLLPPSYEDLVPLNHPVRVVNEVIERIDIGELEASYKGGGAPSYHPRMLLKVVVYAYLRNVFSSRKIEQACAENVHFMWLSGGVKPDHNTINDFRGKRLQGHLKKIFNRVVVLLAEEGVLNLRELTLDGTKIEANANRYTFVWGKPPRQPRRLPPLLRKKGNLLGLLPAQQILNESAPVFAFGDAWFAFSEEEGDVVASRIE